MFGDLDNFQKIYEEIRDENFENFTEARRAQCYKKLLSNEEGYKKYIAKAANKSAVWENILSFCLKYLARNSEKVNYGLIYISMEYFRELNRGEQFLKATEVGESALYFIGKMLQQMSEIDIMMGQESVWYYFGIPQSQVEAEKIKVFEEIYQNNVGSLLPKMMNVYKKAGQEKKDVFFTRKFENLIHLAFQQLSDLIVSRRGLREVMENASYADESDADNFLEKSKENLLCMTCYAEITLYISKSLGSDNIWRLNRGGHEAILKITSECQQFYGDRARVRKLEAERNRPSEIFEAFQAKLDRLLKKIFSDYLVSNDYVLLYKELKDLEGDIIYSESKVNNRLLYKVSMGKFYLDLQEYLSTNNKACLNLAERSCKDALRCFEKSFLSYQEKNHQEWREHQKILKAYKEIENVLRQDEKRNLESAPFAGVYHPVGPKEKIVSACSPNDSLYATANKATKFTSPAHFGPRVFRDPSFVGEDFDGEHDMLQGRNPEHYRAAALLPNQDNEHPRNQRDQGRGPQFFRRPTLPGQHFGLDYDVPQDRGYRDRRAAPLLPNQDNEQQRNQRNRYSMNGKSSS